MAVGGMTSFIKVEKNPTGSQGCLIWRGDFLLERIFESLVHAVCHPYAPTGTVHAVCHAYAPAGTVHAVCHAYAPTGTVHAVCHAYTPTGTVHAVCHA